MSDLNYRMKNIRDEAFKKKKEESNAIYSKMLKHKVEASARYGWDRIMEIISPDLRKRFFRQQQLLTNSLLENDPDEIIKQSEGMMRGITALVEYVSEQGFEELDPNIWITKHHKLGVQILIALDRDALAKCAAICQAEPPSLYFSINEIFCMVPEDTFDVKKRFKENFGDVRIVSRKPIDIDKESQRFIEDEILY